MSKAVLLSIRPNWCKKIANLRKTVEIRKTAPNLEVPFKCYIYCTKAPKKLITIFRDGEESYDGEIYHGKTKFITWDGIGVPDDIDSAMQMVIGEFVCDDIRRIGPEYCVVKEDIESAISGSCLTVPQVKDYAGWKSGMSYADLKDLYCLIELRAGYGDDLPVIMGGSLTCFETETNGADRQTTIEFVDSFTSARDTTVSLSYSGVVNGEKIVRDVAQEMGCEVKLSPKAKMIDFKNFAFVGTGKTLIGRLCDRSKLRWSVQNGIIQICALDEPLTMAAYVLSADSGMIGSPKPFFESASTSSKSSTSKNASSNTTKRKAKKGIEVTYCLNGHIQIDDYVKVESREDKGNYRASKIRFIGDTEGDDWQCVGQFVEVK